MPSDLFHQEQIEKKYHAAPKVESPRVPWFGKDFKQCKKNGFLELIKNHFLNMDAKKASEYAKYLAGYVGFPRSFFYELPNVAFDD